MREFVVVVAVMFAGCATTRDVDRESTGIQTMALGGGFVATGSVAVAGAAVGAGVAVALAETSPVVSVKDAVGSILPYVVAGVVGGGIQIMVGAVLLRNGRAIYLGEDGAPTEAAVAAAEAPVVDERLEQAKREGSRRESDARARRVARRRGMRVITAP